MGSSSSPPSEGGTGSNAGLRYGDDYSRGEIHRVAAAASRIRSAILFVILDAVAVVIGYGLAEVTFSIKFIL